MDALDAEVLESLGKIGGGNVTKVLHRHTSVLKPICQKKEKILAFCLSSKGED